MRHPAGSFAAALTSALNLSLQSLPLRVHAVATPSPTASNSRYPSYLYSWIQLVPGGTSSTRVASCGSWNAGGALPAFFFARPPFCPPRLERHTSSPAAISAMVRSVVTLVTLLSTSASPSSGSAYSSFTFLSIHGSPFSPGRGFRRNSTHSPFIRSPSSVKWRWPSSIVLLGSLRGSGIQRPLSHSMTVPPPYSPLGIVPSKLP